MGDILPSIYLPNFSIYAKHHRLSLHRAERLTVSGRVAGGSTMSLNSSISSNSTFTTLANTETGSTAGGERVFDKEDELKAELLLGTNKLMPKRGKK